MASNLATLDAADGQLDLAMRALNLLFSPTDVALAVLGPDADAAITAAVVKTDAEMALVPAAGEHRKQWESALDERLRKLGAKVLPTAAADAAQAWRDAMVEALSDLPAMVALTAAKQAIHKPFRFVGEVEPAIRELAAEMIQRRRVRRDMLERMREAIRRAAAPAPALDAPGEISAAGIRAMKPELRSLGLKAGHITEAQIEAALADQQAA